jgi:eukaryotic-like serine/threonine-protein kinase
MTLCTSCGDQHSAETTVCPRTGQPMLGGPCGTRIARYEVERLLGDGGMGAVYRARHVMLNQPVAVKLLHAEFSRRGDMLERFLREARAAAAIGNPHIIRVHDCDVTPDGRPFLVMELLEGEGLEALLRRERRLTPQRVVALAQQMLDGLGAAHAAGIIHRDMKPANVFVRKTPDPAMPEFVTVLDFGISKMADPTGSNQHITQTGAVIGTPIYMAPEQIMNPKDLDRRADIYATGVMIYEMLSGRLPYEGANTAELIVKACTVPPTPLREVAPDLPNAIIEVVDRAMAREPSARWQSASEFADALRRALGGAHALPTSPQGSGAANVWSSPASMTGPSPQNAPVMTAAPNYTPPSMAMASSLPAMATPSHWGAAPAAPTHFGAVALAPPPRSGTSRTVLIVGGAVATLMLACCGGSIAWGLLSSNTRTDAPNAPEAPHLTPLPPQTQPIPQVPQVPQMQPMPQGAPSMVPMGAPANNYQQLAAIEGVNVESPRVLGTLSVDGVERALDAAATGMGRCRMATAQTVKVIAIVQPNGRVAIHRAADDNQGDPSAAQCVGNRFAAQHIEGGGSGIVTITAHLNPR